MLQIPQMEHESGCFSVYQDPGSAHSTTGGYVKNGEPGSITWYPKTVPTMKEVKEGYMKNKRGT